MGSGFRPRDHNSTAEMMERFVLGCCAVVEGVLGLKEEVLLAHEDNCWSLKRTPNATKLDKRVTRIKTTSHDKSRTIPETLHAQTRKKDSGMPRACVRASELETDNGKRRVGPDAKDNTNAMQCT